MKKILLLILIAKAVFINLLNAQTQNDEDIVVLKTGKEYAGQIIEQIPGNSIKIITFPNADTLVFYYAQIEKLKKKPGSKEKPTPQINVQPIQSNLKTTTNYTDDATYQIGNDLTVFSEQGYKFAVYINGKRCNDEFSTRITVENVNHNWVSIGVLFEDPARGLIEKNISLSPMDGDVMPYTCTYKIAVTKKNRLVIDLYDYGMKKVAPGTANVLIHRDVAPAGFNFQIQQTTRISR